MAATIRVGVAHGRKDPQSVVRAATVAVVIGIGIALLTALAFVSIPRELVGLYLDLDAPTAAGVIRNATAFLGVAAIFQVVDSIQALANGSLRGLKDTRISMLIAVTSYWLIGVPIGYWMTFHLAWGGVGIWWGLAIGLTTSSAFMIARLLLQTKRLFDHPK